MGYSGDYSLLSRCISEAFATMTFVFFVLALLANKLLPKTKGHDVGYGWMAFGVGLAVFIPVQFLGYISTSLNPAMALGSALVGDISLHEWPPIALSETLGAFVGACLMFVFYYPQFKTEPEPPPQKDADRLLRTRDDIGRHGLDFVSYNTRQPTVTPRLPSTIQNSVWQIGRRLSRTVRRTPHGSLVYNASAVLGPEASRARPNRRRSVTIADLHHRLERMEQNSDPGTVAARARSATVNASLSDEGEIFVQMSGLRNSDMSELESVPEDQTTADRSVRGNDQRFDDAVSGGFTEMDPDADYEIAPPLDPSESASYHPPMPEVVPSVEEDPLVLASKRADENMKLAIFCTRPAIYSPMINLLTEIIATFFLVIGILFMRERSEFLYEGYEDVYRHGIMSLYIGLLIGMLVLCLGGMGVAMNPARDLAPRFAHWILAIDGKGPSEWYYAWIPVCGPLIGAVIAAFIFMAMKELRKNVNDGGFYDQEFGTIFSYLNVTN